MIRIETPSTTTLPLWQRLAMRQAKYNILNERSCLINDLFFRTIHAIFYCFSEKYRTFYNDACLSMKVYKTINKTSGFKTPLLPTSFDLDPSQSEYSKSNSDEEDFNASEHKPSLEDAAPHGCCELRKRYAQKSSFAFSNHTPSQIQKSITKLEQDFIQQVSPKTQEQIRIEKAIRHEEEKLLIAACSSPSLEKRILGVNSLEQSVAQFKTQFGYEPIEVVAQIDQLKAENLEDLNSLEEANARPFHLPYVPKVTTQTRIHTSNEKTENEKTERKKIQKQHDAFFAERAKALAEEVANFPPPLQIVCSYEDISSEGILNQGNKPNKAKKTVRFEDMVKIGIIIPTSEKTELLMQTTLSLH